MRFTTESLFVVVRELREALAREGGVLECTVLDPDLGQGLYAGETVTLAGRAYLHRSYRTWNDLAERLGCSLLTPRRQGDGLVTLRFAPLGPEPVWEGADPSEKYGADSAFARIHKLEEADILLELSGALSESGLGAGSRVLVLGVNRGDELELIARLFPDWREMQLSGVDHSQSALELARRRFPDDNVRLLLADLADFGALELGLFDLVLSVGTLQSPGVKGRELLRRLVQRHLEPASSLVLGFPNCVYRGGELLYGARLKNHSRPDLARLVKELAFYKKYLQQHRFRVSIRGKSYLFVVARGLSRA